MGLPQHKLKQEVCTRWNSTYDMIHVLLEQRDAIDLVLKEKKSDCVLLLDNSEWQLLEEMGNVLKPFKVIL